LSLQIPWAPSSCGRATDGCAEPAGEPGIHAQLPGADLDVPGRLRLLARRGLDHRGLEHCRHGRALWSLHLCPVDEGGYSSFPGNGARKIAATRWWRQEICGV
jgi:hypothetical protein